MTDHHYLQPQNLMYNGYLQLSQSSNQQTHNDASIVQMRTLREQLNQVSTERDQLQKELSHERQQTLQLKTEYQKSFQAQQELNYQCMTLRLEIAKLQQHQHIQTLQQQHNVKSNQLVHQFNNEDNDKEEDNINHICNDCQFETKSQISLFVHKINHKLPSSTPKHLHLPTRMWSTKPDPSISFTYKCPACNDSFMFSRHEIYPHIYQFHSNEQPHKCPICLLYFTHNDYLVEHKFDKHKIGSFEPIVPSSSSRGRGSKAMSRGAKGKSFNLPNNLNPKELIKLDSFSAILINQNSSQSSPITTTVQSPLTLNKHKNEESNEDNNNAHEPTAKLLKTKGHSNATSKARDELNCDYPGCGFTAPTRDRLQFHMSAHTMSKYKCPYCAYVGNILIDIRRHILKSKKHEGLNVFQCQKCDFGSDCERTFKDHLRKNHYGHEIDESILDGVLEEIFLNENNKQNLAEEKSSQH